MANALFALTNPGLHFVQILMFSPTKVVLYMPRPHPMQLESLFTRPPIHLTQAVAALPLNQFSSGLHVLVHSDERAIQSLYVPFLHGSHCVAEGDIE